MRDNILSYRSLVLTMLMSLSLFLCACTSWRDLQPEEFATNEFYVETVELKTTIQQITKMHPLYILNNAYDRAIPKILSASNKAQVWWETGGFAKGSTMAMITFQQPDLSKPQVTAKVYVASRWWKAPTDKYIKMLQYAEQ